MHVGSLQLVKVAQQVTVLLSNVASGIGVVFANKAVFTTAQFRFPVMLTAIHYAVNLVLLVILAAAGFVRWRTAASAERIHLVTAEWALHKGMSNLSLARNSVGLYQISKILVTPLICALERCLYNKVPPPRQAVALVGACAGVFLATVSDVQFTAVGAATALASAVASAVLKVLQQEVLQQHRCCSVTSDKSRRRGMGCHRRRGILVKRASHKHEENRVSYSRAPARHAALDSPWAGVPSLWTP